MTKLESSSLVEEEQVPTLDNTTGTAIAPPKQYKKGVKDGGGEAKNGEEEEECDVEAWDTLSKSFKQERRRVKNGGESNLENTSNES
uniref:Uncharacterized protein n=1 Tax=Salix viminalis TaxID=40686 RepID=A0A6N2LDY9_SALVM